MKITISSSGGTPRAMMLAEELDRKGCLHEFFIPYYDQKHRYLKTILSGGGRRQPISPEKVRVNSAYFLIQRMREMVGLNLVTTLDTRYPLSEFYDRAVARKIDDDSDIIFAESAVALHTIRQAKRMGITTILDRTNSHIQFQSGIVDEEYGRWGVVHMHNGPAVIRKSLKEYEEADYIAVLSSFVRKTFIDNGVSPKKILLIPSGTDLADFEKVGKRDDVFRVIFCGGVSIKKGVPYLLRAFKELGLPNSELWLIGVASTDMTRILREHSGIYKMMGPFPRDELGRYLSQGSVFVMPSLEEGMAKVIIEAMACGLPVIATTNTGAGDLIENGVEGFVVPIRDVAALKEKMLYLYENPDKGKAMGSSGMKKAHSNFSISAYSDRFVQACEKALTTRGRA